MPTERRADARGVETRGKLLAAAEQLLLDEGYASVTSRRVGARAGVAPQLVHYHFRSMEELFVELVRRQGEVGCAAFEELVGTNPSIAELWAFQAGQPLSPLSAELVALANHHKAVRVTIAQFGRRFRELHTVAVTAALRRAGLSTDHFPPDVITVLMTATIQLLGQEEAIGMDESHAATSGFLLRLAAAIDDDGWVRALNAGAAAMVSTT